MTYDDAIKAVQECSYTSTSETDLREMLRACMDINGPNPIAHHRITHAAGIIRQELESRFLSGERTWVALKRSIEELTRIAPADHDVLIIAEDISVLKAEFLPPHSFLLQGIDSNSHRAGVVVHFSQLKARIVYRPKRGAERIITNFAS